MFKSVILSKTKPSFIQRIEQNYAELPPNARKIADHLLHNASDVVSYTVAELANITHTSKATVSRFFRQLGYDSHGDVKHEMNELRAAGYPISIKASEVSGFKAEINRLKLTYENIDKQQIDALVDKIIASKRITLIGFRNSYPMALHCRQQLQQIRGQIRLLPQPRNMGKCILTPPGICSILATASICASCSSLSCGCCVLNANTA